MENNACVWGCWYRHLWPWHPFAGCIHDQARLGVTEQTKAGVWYARENIQSAQCPLGAHLWLHLPRFGCSGNPLCAKQGCIVRHRVYHAHFNRTTIFGAPVPQCAQQQRTDCAAVQHAPSLVAILCCFHFYDAASPQGTTPEPTSAGQQFIDGAFFVLLYISLSAIILVTIYAMFRVWKHFGVVTLEGLPARERNATIETLDSLWTLTPDTDLGRIRTPSMYSTAAAAAGTSADADQKLLWLDGADNEVAEYEDDEAALLESLDADRSAGRVRSNLSMRVRGRSNVNDLVSSTSDLDALPLPDFAHTSLSTPLLNSHDDGLELPRIESKIPQAPTAGRGEPA